MTPILLRQGLVLLITIAIAMPLGKYIYQIMMGRDNWATRILRPIEQTLVRWSGGDGAMTAGEYFKAVLSFSGASFVFLWLVLMLQGHLPLNPQHVGNMSWDLALNTTTSFVTNTNWQAYAGETGVSYLSQMIGLTVQNFVSAGVGLSVMFVLVRGFIQKKVPTIGNFYQDLTRSVLYVLLPLSFVVAIILMSQGVVQTLQGAITTTGLTGAEQWIPLGPAASQIAIKQLGTNGGGFFGMNSAFPLENPTALSNVVEVLSIILIPMALCFSFGHAVREKKQGYILFGVMTGILVLAFVGILYSEIYFSPYYAGVLHSANLEGKEIIHGVGASSLWAAITTAASNGSVNAMMDSFTPLGGMIPMFLMMLGEIIFGGVGSGLYGMLAFVILAVFVASLMVGRTPEYLGKKIEPFEMKMVSLMILVPPMVTLLGTAIAVSMPNVFSWLGNSGPHAFSEVLYVMTSMGNNNGSAFAGYVGDTVFTNVIGSILMALSRFVPIFSVVYMGGSLSNKKFVASSEGTLSTTSGTFVLLLVIVILLIGALNFLPALALGPIADFFVTR